MFRIPIHKFLTQDRQFCLSRHLACFVVRGRELAFVHVFVCHSHILDLEVVFAEIDFADHAEPLQKRHVASGAESEPAFHPLERSFLKSLSELISAQIFDRYYE